MILTPAMQQYISVKNKHPDCIIMFRMGDFYEMFYEDAKTAAKELGITLTSRGKDEKKAPLAGVPYHAVEPYIRKLIKKGYKIAVCEQVEDPKLANGVVKREVVRVITPGTIMESGSLDEKQNNYIMAIAKGKERMGISLADLSTGEFLTTEIKTFEKLENEIARFKPAEIIVPLSLEDSEFLKKLKTRNIFINTFDDRFFWFDKAYSTLTEHFNVLNLDGYGCKGLSINSAGALISYLNETQKTKLNYINKLQVFSTEEFMTLDSSTQKNLELLKNIRDGTIKDTFLEVIDKTVTPMGGRLLKKWLLQPLLDANKINLRLDAVEELTKDIMVKEELKDLLGRMHDTERLISKVMYGIANARDLIALKESLALIPNLRNLLTNSKTPLLKSVNEIKELNHVVELIGKGIKDEPSVALNEGNLIKEGYNGELDKLCNISTNAKKFIATLENNERIKTGIRSLKIKYNKIFGYFIEVSKANLHLVPTNYIRKQTQVNAERFVTEELKEQESLILSAEERIIALEYKLFSQIIEEIKKESENIQFASKKISELDVLLSFAIVAVNNNYVRPKITENYSIIIKNGRHPVIENIEENFIPNDCFLNEKQRFLVVTGPNMAGKSTVLRQIALIILMAQIGGFVPASEAEISLVDRIFTRVGASDDLSRGRSTFMVEMNETANILNNATSKSLIILDEIGRGTSTFDGISIAWAIAEYIYNNIQAKTLFATHYHQLNKLSEEYENIRNYNIAVKEIEDNIVFLRKLVEGGTDKSYGIEVAKLAGLPLEVIEKARAIMNKLEKEDEIVERIYAKTLRQTNIEKWQ